MVTVSHKKRTKKSLEEELKISEDEDNLEDDIEQLSDEFDDISNRTTEELNKTYPGYIISIDIVDDETNDIYDLKENKYRW